jgi:uncharacterized phiE125 gp8 family phage protein
MALKLTAAPEAEPVSLSHAKAHLRLETDDEDQLLEQLIVTARLLVERELGIALLTQSWSLLLDAWPASGIATLPICPLQGVDLVTVYREGGETAVEPDALEVDTTSQPGRVLLKAGGLGLKPGVRLNGIEIGFTAEFGDEPADVPEPLRHALVLLIAHWFERREPVILGVGVQEVPGMAARLLAPYRRTQL